MIPPRAAFFRGLRQALPFTIVVAPFGLLFGVVATEAGLNLWETMVFTSTVFAGASQFAALQLMQDQAPTLIVLVTAMAVNLRMVMYSVAITPHLGKAGLGWRALMAYFLVDQSFAVSSVEFDRNPDLTIPARIAFFFGAVSPIAPLWYAATFAGAAAGRSIPPGWALDFAVPITFLAICAPLLRSLPHLCAALTSILLALLFSGLPWGTGLLIAAAGAMTVGALVELRIEKGRRHAG